MRIRHNIWRFGAKPEAVKEGKLETEAVLEEMIVAAPDILSPEWMFIGRQEDTGYGGRIDLLALAPDGALILIELKRAKTPREVVAQAIDYAGLASRSMRIPSIRVTRSSLSPHPSIPAANESSAISTAGTSLSTYSSSKCSRLRMARSSAVHGCTTRSTRRSQPRLPGIGSRKRNPGTVSTTPRLGMTSPAHGMRR